MPSGAAETHTLYMEIASLQMTRARQIKIRDALREQIARCDAEIERCESRCQQLQSQIDEREEAPRRGAKRRASATGASPGTKSSEERSGPTVADLRAGAFTFKY